MATIVRGFNFAPNDLCTADRLNDLVRLAQVDDVELSDVVGCSIYTAAATSPAGWLTYVYERHTIDSGPTCADLSFMLRTYGSPGTVADVALWNPYRLETKRYDGQHSGLPNIYGPLGYTHTGGVDDQALELRVDYAITNRGAPQCITFNVPGSSQTDPASLWRPRMAIKGLAPVRLSMVAGGTYYARHYVHGSSLGYFNYLINLAIEPISVISLAPEALDNNSLQIGYLTGGPCWRA